jgi:xanthine dehydrogenase accessory factor
VHEWKRLQNTWNKCLEKKESVVMATLVSTQGSTYRRPGVRALITQDGHCEGLLSGGCLEGDITERAQQVFATGKPQLAVYDMRSSDDLIFGLGLGCEGRLEVWIEKHDAKSPPLVLQGKPGETHECAYVAEDGTRRVFLSEIPAIPAVVVFGAGMDAIPVVILMDEMGFHVCLADGRPGVLEAFDHHIFVRTGNRKVEKYLFAKGEDSLAQYNWFRKVPETFDAAVLMNHHFETDAWCLAKIFENFVEIQSESRNRNTFLKYVGLLGPQKRREMLFDKVPQAARFFPEIVRGPAGFDLGGEGPESVALSIVSEIHAVCFKRSGLELSRKIGSIHCEI